MFYIVAFVGFCSVMIFLPSMSMFSISIFTHQMNWFLFLLLLCKFPFDGPKLLDVTFVLLPGEFEMSMLEAI